MAVRKQLKHDETIDIWPITDASAVHYTYNPSDQQSILSPVANTSYGLDNFLNGLQNQFMTKSEVAALATNIYKGKGLLYNGSPNVTSAVLPASAVTDAIVRCTYNSSGDISFSFDTTAYLPTSTTYANSGSVAGDALRALALSNGTAYSIPYQTGAGATSFLAAGTAGQVLQCGGPSSPPSWVNNENYQTVTMVTTGYYQLAQNSWQTINSITEANGTYALYIQDSFYGSYSGVFSLYGTHSKLDEIPLHWASSSSTDSDTNRIYAAIQGGNLLLSSNDNGPTTHELTIKYKRII